MQNLPIKKHFYFVGDIHGQYKKLIDLLQHIKFDHHDLQSPDNNAQLVFVGDLIDNARNGDSDHLALLNKVEALVANNRAVCLLGNHEFNAVGWAMQNEDGNGLRPHTENNRKQHQAFLDEVGEGSEEHKRWVAWFKSLPLFIDFEAVKTIHACWDEAAIEQLKPYLNPDNSLKAKHWVDAFDESHELFALCEILLKGPERQLPAGQSFKDKTGKVRTRKRIEWWNDSAYRESAVPIVIGHYTLSGKPEALSNKVVCVDYNAAKGDNPLVCCLVDCHNETLFTENVHFHYVYQEQ